MTSARRRWALRALAMLCVTACTQGGASAAAQATMAGGPTSLEVWAFHAPWDPRSAESAVRNRERIDVMVSGWIALDTAAGRAQVLYTDSLVRTTDRRTRYAALVTSWLGDRFHPSTVNRLAGDAAALASTASFIARHARETGYSALVLDFEAHEAEDLEGLVRVVKAIADTARSHGIRQIVLAIPAADDAYPAPRLLEAVDFVLPMLYDEHWSTSAPGPVASPTWVRSTLTARLAEAGTSRVIAALPLYGYWWQPGTPAAQTIGIADARRLSADRRIALERDAATSTLTARADGVGELWVTDATLLRELLTIVADAGVRRVALWRLGLEDPAMWDLLPR